MADEAPPQVIWRPQPGPQAALVRCPVYEILYGGARGGGKTDGMLGKNAIKAQRWGPHQKGIFFRRELPQLEAAIARAQQIYNPLGWTWLEQKKTFVAPNGATLKFRPLERDGDAEKYQGHDYTDVYFEELTNYGDPKPVMRMHAVLRSGAGVPCQMHATANPGGPGHHWVKARYIDPAPGGWEILKDEHGNERVFIPAKVSDNARLLENDPHYVARLRQSGSAALVRAWLEGDWSVIEGAYFDGWSAARHVIRPHPIPETWLRFRAMDWGSAAPFSVGWYAVSDGTLRGIPKGALVRYREWYGASAPNVGLKLYAEAVADGILERTPKGEKIAYTVVDTSMFDEDGGPSQAERMAKRGLIAMRADKRRLPGWDQVRARLAGDGDGLPMLLVFDTCPALIRTLPALQHDEGKPEDVDSDGEDHAADELRYACMSRPWTRPPPASLLPIDAKPTLNDVFRAQPSRPSGRI